MQLHQNAPLAAEPPSWRQGERGDEPVARHKLYGCIVRAFKSGNLNEPFRAGDLRKACPGFAEGTCGTFLPKHRVGNPGGDSELFERVSRGRYKLVRPYKYGIDC